MTTKKAKESLQKSTKDSSSGLTGKSSPRTTTHGSNKLKKNSANDLNTNDTPELVQAQARISDLLLTLQSILALSNNWIDPMRRQWGGKVFLPYALRVKELCVEALQNEEVPSGTHEQD